MAHEVSEDCLHCMIMDLISQADEASENGLEILYVLKCLNAALDDVLDEAEKIQEKRREEKEDEGASPPPSLSGFAKARKGETAEDTLKRIQDLMDLPPGTKN